MIRMKFEDDYDEIWEEFGGSAIFTCIILHLNLDMLPVGSYHSVTNKMQNKKSDLWGWMPLGDLIPP